MVGRSRPLTISTSNENTLKDSAAEEILCLRSQNKDLAKALAEAQLSIKEITQEKTYFQNKFLVAHKRNFELVNYIKRIDQAARKSINALVLSSNYITEIAEVIAGVEQSGVIHSSLCKGSETSMVETPNSEKLRAVKPMIDGHVIHRPTISLRRVNESLINDIPRTRQAMQTLDSSSMSFDTSNNVENNSHHLSTSTNLHSFNDNAGNISMENLANEEHGVYEEEQVSDHHQSSFQLSRESINNNRLHTIEEVTEDLLNNSLENRSDEGLSTLINADKSSIAISDHNSQGPLLSGIFRDVRVYLSPMQDASKYFESLQVPKKRVRIQHPKELPKRNCPTRTLDDSNRCIVSINSPNINQSNITTDSANSLFDNSVSSILTSTRISNNFNETCQVRQSEYVNKRRDYTNIENVTVEENVNSQNSLNSCQKEISNKENILNGQSGSSAYTPNVTSTTCDPLEGSSLNDFNNISKIEQFRLLGLSPISQTKNLSQSGISPASSKLKRRAFLQNQVDSTTTNKSIYITKRNLDVKKPIISLSVRNKRKSFSPSKTNRLKRLSSSLQIDMSPSQLPFVQSPRRDSKKNVAIVELLKKPVTHKLGTNIDLPLDSSIESPARKPRNSKIKKLKLKTAQMRNVKKSLSPGAKPKRQRMARSKILSLKEPSKRTKLRRAE